MRLFTYVLAQMYEKQGLTMSHQKANDHFLEEFEIQHLDPDELKRENDEMKPQIAKLEQDLSSMRTQLEQARAANRTKSTATIQEVDENAGRERSRRVSTQSKQPAEADSIYIKSIDEFNQLVSATAGGKPLVVDFTATWCPPCKKIGPVYDGLMANYPALIMKKVDVDEVAEVTQVANVEAFPTFKVYKGGVESDCLSGADEEGLVQMLDKAKS